MPVVPMQQLPEVGQRPLGAPQIHVDTRGAFGEGVATGLEQLAGGVSHLATAAQEAKAKADVANVDLALADLKNGVIDTLDSTEVDPTTGQRRGFRWKQGRDAAAASADTLQQIQKTRDSIASSLTNEEQKQLYLRHSNGVLLDAHRQIEVHAGQAIQQAQAADYKALSAATLNSVSVQAFDPVAREREIASLEPRIRLEAAHQGLSSETANELVREWRAQAAGVVLNQYLARQDGTGAAAYFATVKDTLGVQAAKYEHDVLQVSQAQEGELLARKAIAGAVDPASGRVDEQKAIAAIDALPVGPVADAARARLEHRLGVIEKVQTKAVTDLVNTAISQFLQGGHSLTAVASDVKARILNPISGKPEAWHALEGMQQAWQAHVRGAPATQEQQDAYAELMWKSRFYPELFDGWDANRFRAEYGPRLNPKDFEPGIRTLIENTSRGKDVKGKAAFDYMKQAGEASGMFPNQDTPTVKRSDPGTWSPDQRAVLSQAQRSVQAWLDTLDHNPKPNELQLFVDDLFLKGELPRRYWMNKPTTRIGAEAEGRSAEFIPNAREQIVQQFHARGVNPSEAQIQAALAKLNQKKAR